jgi:hypothetical protein
MSEAENNNSPFFIGKDNFEEDFLPVYQKIGLSPNYLMQFPIILPFHIPLVSGTCFTMQLEDGNACTFLFSDIETTDSISAGVIRREPLKVPIKKSYVEMTFVVEDDIELKQEQLTYIFETLLSKLNCFLLSYKIHKKDMDAHRLTKEMLEFGCLYRLVKIEDWSTTEGLFLSHMRVPVIKDELNKEDHDQILWYAYVIDRELNPFTISEELMLRARQYLWKGFYRESILFAQTSVETFLKTLFILLLKQEEKEDKEIEEIVENIAFMKIIKSELPSRLGGNWNIEIVTESVGQWYHYCYKLRNRISHAGYNPSVGEVNDCLHFAQDMRKFVLELIQSRRRKYADILVFLETPTPAETVSPLFSNIVAKQE